MATSKNENGSRSFWPRWEENKPFALLLMILLVYSIVYLGLQIRSQGEPEPSEHMISIEGQARISSEPTLATVTIGVETTDETVAAAQDKNSQTMNALTQLIKEIGIEAADLQTSSYNVFENQEWDGETYVAKGWTVSQQLTVKIHDTAMVESVFEAAGQNGATSISGPEFTIDDEEALKDKARQEAVSDAQEKAAKLAQRLNFKLGKITSYSEWVSEPADTFRSMTFGEFGGGGPDIETGSEEMTFSVVLTYLIE